jgi:hypothetical protein
MGRAAHGSPTRARDNDPAVQCPPPSSASSPRWMPPGPDQVNCLGQPTSPARYFTDLILLSYLIRRSWPLARDLAPSPALADALDAYLTHPQEAIRRRPDTSQASRWPPTIARRSWAQSRAPPC